MHQKPQSRYERTILLWSSFIFHFALNFFPRHQFFYQCFIIFLKPLRQFFFSLRELFYFKFLACPMISVSPMQVQQILIINKFKTNINCWFKKKKTWTAFGCINFWFQNKFSFCWDIFRKTVIKINGESEKKTWVIKFFIDLLWQRLAIIVVFDLSNSMRMLLK